jgi:hypothetical protein
MRSQSLASPAVVFARPTEAWVIQETTQVRRWSPPTSRAFAEFVWVAFVAAQAADGAFTYAGMRIFGVEIEANPIIAFYASSVGPGPAILGAKAVAIVSALILYGCGRHRTLGVLTIWYLLIAIWPWTLVLWP